MSSDERIKKLRGSGGHVIARVSDEQQSKGNLGGPDLFLSPIGRLDPASISKYYCNSCEKEYEGGPRIDYESPNEEVAENLVLVEKGQYACQYCPSTIAEYRIFSKKDEAAEVGLAKPEAAQAPQQQQQAPEQPAAQAPQQQQQAPEQPAAQAPQQQQQAPEQPAAQAPQQAPQQQQAPEQPAAQAPQQQQQAPEQPEVVRPIAGMSVFDENGNVVGTAREVGVARDSGIVLVVQTPDGGDTAVRWGRIGKIGEIVLLKACDDSCCAEQPGGSPPGCPACGFANGPGSKFCEQCGGKV